MSSFVRMPIRTVHWKCPKCGKVTATTERPNPLIHTCLPLFSGSSRPPVCPKCKVKMVKNSVWNV
ncbi:MAG: hypothetical protein E7055_00315 [Lentisphaerae bacterium]|nr:hypothetical protein [Lentisphaerota bacterium]